MRSQLKFTVDSDLVRRFEQAVLRRRGKLDLSREGAEAIRLYLEHVGEKALETREEPILRVLGIATSRRKARPDALKDKRRHRRNFRPGGKEYNDG